MKVISRGKMRKMDEEILLNEINIMKFLDHPNIIKIYEFFHNKNNYYLLTE